MSQKMTDSELIKSLGGPAKVAEMLCYKKRGGVQRVQNWVARGIPPRVKIEHPEIFLRKDARARNELRSDRRHSNPPGVVILRAHDDVDGDELADRRSDEPRRKDCA